jgi:hypothetical protein
MSGTAILPGFSGHWKTKKMKRIRNPRFAPEFLERKLSPSGFISNPGASAFYSTPNLAPSQDVTSVSNTSSDQTLVNPTSNAIFYATPPSLDGESTDSAASGPTSDGPSAPAPDPNPDDPGDADGDPGEPDPMPAPPVPIGPTVPGY